MIADGLLRNTSIHGLSAAREQATRKKHGSSGSRQFWRYPLPPDSFSGRFPWQSRATSAVRRIRDGFDNLPRKGPEAEKPKSPSTAAIADLQSCIRPGSPY